MMERKEQVPQYSKAFFKWICKDGYFEELEGDLEEEFYRNVASKGENAAKWLYRKEILLMIRPSVIRKISRPTMSTSSGSMLNNYVKTAFRNIRKGALFSGINIIGLSLSMSVGLLLISGITYQMSFDQFHVNKDRSYRVITNLKDSYFGTRTYATTSVALADDFLKGHKLVDDVVRINSSFGGNASTGSKTLPLEGLFVDEDFFDLLSFNLVQGDYTSALSKPFSIILTERSAKLFFEDGEAFGKAIEVSGLGLFQVTGIVQNPPSNSHLQFSSLVSFSTIETLVVQDSLFLTHKDYNNLNAGYLYFSLVDEIDPKEIEMGLNSIAQNISSRYENQDFEYELQPLANIVPGRAMSNQIGPEMEFLVLIVFSVLAGIIIVSTCFNYTNLSVARALGRTKEIAIRKTMGGTRFQIFIQFIIEAIVISFLALVGATLISILLKPHIYSINADIQEMFSFDITPMVAIYFILFAITVGILAGFLPALILSKQETLKLLKGSDQFRFLRFLNLRKSLIIFQFSLSLICIISASIILKQFRYSINFDMGFDREQVLNVRLYETDPNFFIDEFSKIPEISTISMSSGYLGVGARSRYWMRNEKAQDSMVVNYLSISPGYLKTHSISLIAGRTFNENDFESSDELIVINEKFTKEFQLGTPEEAIGEVIYSPRNKAFRIIGVTKNFNYDRLRNPIGSFFFMNDPRQFNYANLKVISSDITNTMDKVDASWTKINEINKLNAEFYDDRVEEAYSFYKIALGIIGFVTTLTILIAFMGLLGIVIYTSKSRTKEVAIRKVLGAEEKGLVYLLSKSFIRMMIWATTISVGLTFAFFNFVVLPKETYRADLGFWDFGLGVIIIVGIGLITITTQTIRVARKNPVESIQNE